MCSGRSKHIWAFHGSSLRLESTIELVGSQPPLGSRNSAKSGRERSERPIWSGKRSARLGSPFSLDVPRVNRRSVDLSVVRVSRLDVGDRWSSGSAMGPTAFAGGARPKDPFVFQGLNDPPTSLVFTDGWMHEPNSRSMSLERFRLWRLHSCGSKAKPESNAPLVIPE